MKAYTFLFSVEGASRIIHSRCVTAYIMICARLCRAFAFWGAPLAPRRKWPGGDEGAPVK